MRHTARVIAWTKAINERMGHVVRAGRCEQTNRPSNGRCEKNLSGPLREIQATAAEIVEVGDLLFRGGKF